MYDLKTVFHDIACDYRRYVEHESAFRNRYLNFIYIIILCRGFYVAAGYRFKRWLQIKADTDSRTRFIWMLVKSVYIKSYQIFSLVFVKVQMPNNADIGPGLYISSGGNIIMGLTMAGEKLSVYENVTIGMDLGRSFVPPTFGNNVCIHTNSVVTSNNIGDSVTVLPNSLLTKSVASNLVLGGNPARIIKNHQNNEQDSSEETDSAKFGVSLSHFKCDIERYLSKKSSREMGWVSMLEKPGLQAVLVYRLGMSIRRHMRNPLLIPIAAVEIVLHKIVQYLCKTLYGINIGKDVVIGKGLRISHFGGILVEKCTIGDNCSIEQHVVIKCASNDSYPVIGNNVWIGSNAVIIGNVKIGSNSTISACSYVTSDVQEGSLVAGSPARVVKTNYDNSNLL